MLADLKEIAEALEKLSVDIDVQMAAATSDSKQFHENLINLLSEFPDDKELIQFIVFINDRLETNQTISKDIFMDSLKAIIKQKLILVKRLIREQEAEIEKKNQPNKFVKILQLISDNKMTLIIISVAISLTIVFSSLYLNPKDTIETLKIINSTATKGAK
jgi:hypothetical protein